MQSLHQANCQRQISKNRLLTAQRAQVRLQKPRFQPATKEVMATTPTPVHVDQGLLQSFVSDKTWAKAIMKIQADIHEQLQQELEILVPQGTRFSADGRLKIVSTDGRTNFNVQTHAGTNAVIKHKYLTHNVVSGLGVLHTKTGVHANIVQGTPFLDIEIGGNQQSVLLAAVLTPRLATLRHKWYMTKYYKTVPDSEAGDNSMPFSELYKRMLSRAEGAGAVYTHFHSPAVYTRMMQGHGAFFTFNPSNPEAIRAVTEDVRALTTLWCAWAGADAQDDNTILTDKDHVEECCDMSRNMARFLEFDDDAAAARKMMSEEDFKKLVSTLSGEASTAGEPLWM